MERQPAVGGGSLSGPLVLQQEGKRGVAGKKKLVHSKAEADKSSRQEGTGRWAGPLLLFLFSLYVLTGKGFTELVDAEAQFLLAQRLVERHWVDLPPEGGLTTGVIDGRSTFHGPDGRIYSQYWLGYPLWEVPWYCLGVGAGRLLRPLLGEAQSQVVRRMLPRAAVNLSLGLITAVEAVVLAQLLLVLGQSLRTAAGTGLLFGLGTVAWPYAKIGFYEPLLGLCLLASWLFLATYIYRRQHWTWLLLVGLVWGWGFATKPTFALTLPGLGFFTWWARRGVRGQSASPRTFWAGLGAIVLGLTPWVAVVLWYNWARTGQVLDPGYAAWNWEATLTWQHFLRLLAAYTISPGRGLLVFCPVVLLSVIGWRRVWHEQPVLAASSLLLFLPYLLFHAARVAPDSWAWGPRYLVPVVGPVMLLAPWGWRLLTERRGGRGVAMAIVGLAVVVQVVSVIVPYGTWMHRVHEQTGTSDAVVFSLRYWPLGGQVDTLRRVEMTRVGLEGSGAAGGATSAEFKERLRRSLDFWWFYAWRLGASPAVLVTMVVGLLMIVLWSGKMVTSRARLGEAGGR